MKKLAVIAILLATPAFSQDAKPADPTPPKATPPYFFMLDDADLNIIAAGLNELQKKTADPFLFKLQGQLNDQAKIKAAAGKP
jgi:hypothetical protein